MHSTSSGATSETKSELKGTLDDASIHIGPSMISLQFMLGKGLAVENLISLHEESQL